MKNQRYMAYTCKEKKKEKFKPTSGHNEQSKTLNFNMIQEAPTELYNDTHDQCLPSFCISPRTMVASLPRAT